MAGNRNTLTIPLGRQQLEVRWTALDRAIESIAPVWAGRRLQARVGHAMTASIGAQMGGYNGASRSRRSLTGWGPTPGDADADALPDLPDLRARCADLTRNSAVAGGAVNTTCAHVVGSGLSLQCSVDAAFLGLDEDAVDEWQQDVERKFNAWWETTDCDITRTQTGYGLQDLSLRGEIVRGDCFAVLTRAQWARGPVKLAVQLIEGDRCCNPDRKPNSTALIEGVELDPAGAPVAYHFANANPHRRSQGKAAALTWQRIPAFGARTGRRNVLHLFDRDRIGLTRGVPMLAPVIEPLKQLERYTEAELMAAVVSGLFTVFIESEGQPQIQPTALAGAGGAQDAGGSGGWNGQLGNGLVVELGKNEKIESANPGRPNAQFDPFVNAIVRQIGMMLGIPYEVLVKHYTSSYSAARAAMLDAWRYFRTRRDRHATYFCAPIFEAWMDEAVSTGYISAPGYFADPLLRRAWLGHTWIGDGPGSLDPVKEVKAAADRVDLGISTREAESILHDGGKLRPKLRQLAREARLMREMGIATQPPAVQTPAPPAVTPPDGDDPLEQ